MSIVRDIIREAARSRLAELRAARERDAKAATVGGHAAEDARGLLLETARLRRERDGWLEIAHDSQRRVSELEEKLRAARGATRTT